MSFAHFTLATKDPQKTGAFFEATLGYRQVETPDNSPMDLCWLELAPGQQIHLVRVDNFGHGANSDICRVMSICALNPHFSPTIIHPFS